MNFLWKITKKGFLRFLNIQGFGNNTIKSYIWEISEEIRCKIDLEYVIRDTAEQWTERQTGGEVNVVIF